MEHEKTQNSRVGTRIKPKIDELEHLKPKITFLRNRREKMNELKKELSKLTGIDMFSPRFREVFKKYFPEDRDAEEEKFEAMEDLEEIKAPEVEPEVEEEPAVEDAVKEEKPEVEPEVEDKPKEIAEDIEKAEDEREIDKIEEEKAEEPEIADEKKEEVNEESEEIGEKVDELKDNYDDELYDAKLELALIKHNVREDRIEPAKKYIKSEIKDAKDLDKVGDVLKEFPEWIKRENHDMHGFGMSVDESGDGLTEEEKRLKAMGIDPRE